MIVNKTSLRKHIEDREAHLLNLRKSSENSVQIAARTKDYVLIKIASESVIGINHNLDELKLIREKFKIPFKK